MSEPRLDPIVTLPIDLNTVFQLGKESPFDVPFDGTRTTIYVVRGDRVEAVLVVDGDVSIEQTGP